MAATANRIPGCRLSGFTPDRIVHQGAQLLAQRLIATALSDAHLTVTRGGGVRGAADERLAAGYKALKSAGLADADITASRPSRLGYACTSPRGLDRSAVLVQSRGCSTARRREFRQDEQAI